MEVVVRSEEPKSRRRWLVSSRSFLFPNHHLPFLGTPPVALYALYQHLTSAFMPRPVCPLSPQRRHGDLDEQMGLSNLPYDLLLNITTYLTAKEVHSLHLTCKSLYDALTTRPVYRHLANQLLRRCRALPLKGFQRLSDLSTEALIQSVTKASHYEKAWRTRAPRPITAEPYKNGVNCRSNYMDVAPGSDLEKKMIEGNYKWYKIVTSPPDEEVDWLSPITSSYTLCATKSGKVVCWDVQSDTCLAEWNPGARWELWKCRVEFEERTVFFTMAKVIAGSVMQFVLMRLTFSDGPSGESSPEPPIFSHVTEFRTTGVVMNVFLLDPSERLLSAFIWVSASNTIGLYTLPDWNKKEYVFIDTGIECINSSNWSCILYQGHIVIHCEESDAAFQHFYPLSLLKNYRSKLQKEDSVPVISGHVAPARTLKKKFIFPLLGLESTDEEDSDSSDELGPDLEAEMANTINPEFLDSSSSSAPTSDDTPEAGPSSSQTNSAIDSSSPSSSSTSSAASAAAASSASSLVIAPPVEYPNPFPSSTWYPESAHFVRQWWPSLPNIPRVSCTVVLLACHDPTTHRTRFVLAQHYFRVPLDHAEWIAGLPEAVNAATNGKAPETSKAVSEAEAAERAYAQAQDDALMHLWYVAKPFEVVRVFDGLDEDDDGVQERPRPLVAVDFGHAVWIEYEDLDDERSRGLHGPESEHDPKVLRFVTFPPFSEEHGVDLATTRREGVVRTLQTPPELDLGEVETINIDQSQGAIILSDKNGKIFILCYE